MRPIAGHAQITDWDLRVKLVGIRRYRGPPGTARTIGAPLTLRDHVIAPTFALIRGLARAQTQALDRAHENLRISMQALFDDLGISALRAAAA